MALNIDLLESSFQAVAPKADELADKFYERLFRKYPQVKPLFANTDMAQQKQHLISALALVVANLRKPTALNEAIKALAIRHVGYGVKPEQYAMVGENLLATLAVVAGDLWTQQLHDAWAEAYNAIEGMVGQALDEYLPPPDGRKVA